MSNATPTTESRVRTRSSFLDATSVLFSSQFITLKNKIKPPLQNNSTDTSLQDGTIAELVGAVEQELEKFVHLASARKEAVLTMHTKMTTARGPDEGYITRPLRRVWTIYSTLIEGVVSDWELVWKNVLSLVVNIRLKQFELAGRKNPKKFFGKQLADEIIGWQRDLPADKKFVDKFDEYVKSHLHNGRQHISVCSGVELMLLVPPLAPEGRVKIPEAYHDVVLNSLAVKRAKRPTFDQTDANAYDEALNAEKLKSHAGKLLDLALLELPNLLMDDERHCMELCIQMRHLRVHEGWSPTADDQVQIALFIQQTFVYVATVLPMRLRRCLLLDDSVASLEPRMSLASI